MDGVVDLVCVDTFMRPGLKKESTTGDLGNLPKVIMPVSYIYIFLILLNRGSMRVKNSSII